jgi:hypothetical protein
MKYYDIADDAIRLLTIYNNHRNSREITQLKNEVSSLNEIMQTATITAAEIMDDIYSESMNCTETVLLILESCQNVLDYLHKRISKFKGFPTLPGYGEKDFLKFEKWASTECLDKIHKNAPTLELLLIPSNRYDSLTIPSISYSI